MTRHRTISLRCAHDGCPEFALYNVSTVREDSKLRAKPWYCPRHRDPDRVLSPAEPVKTGVLVNEETPHGLFWGGQRGFVDGPGFCAFARDFPPGAELKVTASIKLPGRERAVS